MIFQVVTVAIGAPDDTFHHQAKVLDSFGGVVSATTIFQRWLLNQGQAGFVKYNIVYNSIFYKVCKSTEGSVNIQHQKRNHLKLFEFVVLL